MESSIGKNKKEKKSKKPVTNDILKNLGYKDSSQQEESQPKRRLRKQRHQSEDDQEFVPNRSEPQQQDFGDSIHKSDKQEKFQRFNIKDDEDLKKEEQQKQTKKRSKKLKGNQEIDKFISDNNKNQKKQRKKAQTKNEGNPNTQMTLEAMFNLKKIKKPKKISSQQQLQEPIQQQIDQDQLVRKRLHAQKNLYQKINGSLQDQMDLLQKAKKLSLQSAKKQRQKSEDNLDHFKFQNKQINANKSKTFQQQLQQQKAIKQKNRKFQSSEDDEPYKRTQVDHKKSEKKVQRKKQRSQSKQEQPDKRQPSKNKKSKKIEKQKKQGPLADETIVFTGQFQPYSKDQLVELCQKLGANTPKSFAVKTTILLQGAYVVDQFKRKSNQPIQTTDKSKRALQKGIRIVPNSDLDDFFLQKTGKSLAQHFQKNRLDTFAQKQQPPTINMDIEVNPQSMKQSMKGDKKVSTDTTLWTQKYKPSSLEQVLGQHKQIDDLRLWLTDWEDVHFKGNKKQVKGERGFLPTGTINSKAALLSGDPGLGKTTTARLLGQELGFNIVEFNASDIRNKKGVKLLQNNSLGLHSSANLMKTLIIMDEVDGMSSGDRGGITQIIMMIKGTKVPMICICNDRQSQKIRSLAGHCFDIRFHRPDKRLIIKRLHQIVAKQHGKASDLVLSRIVQTFQNDMRQILNYLELLMKTKTKQLQIKMMGETDRFSKDSAVMLTHFDATRKLLNRGELDQMKIRDRLDCYFIDSDMVPLMVHENYIASMKKDKLSKADFHKLVKATEGFVIGDILDKNIRKQQDYSLMPAVGYMTCVYPTEMVSASFGFPQFPSWLGKFSSQRKQKRLIRQLKNALASQITGGNRAVKYHYAPLLFRQIQDLLKHQKIQATLDMMQFYGLTPDSLNQTLIGVQYNPSKLNLMGDISAATKTKLTKLYKKRHEQMRLTGKAKKASGSTMQHHKYNPIMQDLDDDDAIVQEQQQQIEQQQANEVVMVKKDNKKKGGKK